MGKETNENLPIEERLSRIEGLLLSNKKVLTFDEVVAYTGFKASYLISLLAATLFLTVLVAELFFEKDEIDAWLLENKCKPTGK